MILNGNNDISARAAIQGVPVPMGRGTECFGVGKRLAIRGRPGAHRMGLGWVEVALGRSMKVGSLGLSSVIWGKVTPFGYQRVGKNFPFRCPHSRLAHVGWKAVAVCRFPPNC